MPTFDSKLNVSKAAWDVLRSLKKATKKGEFDAATLITTAAFYNGRERGISITVKVPNRKDLVVVFCERRSSDNIVVWHWKDSCIYNPPASLPDDIVYRNGVDFDYDQSYPAAQYVHDLIKGHLL